MFFRRFSFLKAVVTIVALGLIALAPSAVSAQDADPDLSYTLAIIPTGEAIPDLPDHTVSITVFNADQSVAYGSCVLSLDTQPAGCSVQVPPETDVIAVLDEDTLPAGVGIVENDIAYTTPAEVTQVGDIWFEFVYVDSGEEPVPPADPGPVDELPSTGSGTTATDTHGASYAFALLGSALMVAATLVRRVATR